MIIERTQESLTFKVSPKIKTEDIQNLVDYITYLEITANTQANQEAIDELASEVNRNWWTLNRNKLIK